MPQPKPPLEFWIWLVVAGIAVIVAAMAANPVAIFL
jgi:hypothetical protein